LADQLNGHVLLAEELPVFLAEAVHAFAGCLHFLRTADALRQILQGFLELRGKIGRDAGGGLSRVHGIAPFSSM
jgi:hypothetical protein